MRKWSLLAAGLLLAAIIAGAGLFAYFHRRERAAASAAAAGGAAAGESAASRPTPADRLVAAAQAVVSRSPRAANGYNQLCAAYMQKARETGDFLYYARADAALRRSLELDPATDGENYDALRMQAGLLLTHHRFKDALELARRMRQLRPDDHYVYGVMTDALVELGDYQAAVEAADKMSDLRPSAASYSRISYLRSLHGHTEPAVEAMRLAVRASSPSDGEGHAWFRVHLGDELMNAGRRAEAEREYAAALAVFPDYHLALAAQARARVAEGKLDEAVELYRRAEARVPTPEGALALGGLYTKLGRADEARREYERFESLAGAGGGIYAVRRAVFLADHGARLDEALELARRERAARSDIYTCDALAWALFKKGQFKEAEAAAKEALRLGTRDALIHYHAGMIYDGLGDRRAAAKHLRLALDINPAFDVLQADVAKRTLDLLPGARRELAKAGRK
jgi:tetratricopeptide (TPR) repeat protein